jgi:hypothetical protein
MSSAAIGLGIINLLMVHGAKVLHRKKGGMNSLVLLSALFVTLGIEMIDLVRNEQSLQTKERLQLYSSELLSDSPRLDLPTIVRFLRTEKEEADRALDLSDVPATAHEQWSAELAAKDRSALSERIALGQRLATELAATELSAPQQGATPARAPLAATVKEFAASHHQALLIRHATSPIKKLSRLLYDAFYVSLGSAMFSLLAFYIANAAYRSFRIRSLEAALMMISAVLIILGQIPHGALYISEHLPEIRLWLMTNINTPARRAVFFGTEIAGLAIAVRIWLSLERAPVDITGGETGGGAR